MTRKWWEWWKDLDVSNPEFYSEDSTHFVNPWTVAFALGILITIILFFFT